jgi:BCD family chlorophyll transporter-like MFS transporter
MNRVTGKIIHTWASYGTRWLPFADVASADLPLSRLLRLSLFQVTVGMALVLLVGTLNRVMIVELGVPASIVGVVLALPLLFAPFRALIGHKSDTFRSAIGWRRVPFIWKGTMWQFGGFAIMPFALLVLAGKGHAADVPVWVGFSAAALSFLLVGAGVHMVQTVGLALATDLAPREDHPKIVGLMYVMLLFGMTGSAFIYSWLLADFSPGRLVQVIQGTAVVTVVLNFIALWKQEGRNHKRSRQQTEEVPMFGEAWNRFVAGKAVVPRLVVIGLGAMGFGMADVIMEPYGGQVLGMSVAETTRLTATLAIGTLVGFGLASRVLSRGADPLVMAGFGALAGIPGFALLIASAPLGLPLLFAGGTLLVGFGAGLFGHGTLTATMQSAPTDQAGLALGAWGAVQASAAGLGIALGGIIRDLFIGVGANSLFGAANAYVLVFAIEIALLVAALAVLAVLLRSGSPRPSAA